MHSPETLAFNIYLGPKKKRNGHYRSPIISVWHKDPCKDGTDDSCGWFIRDRHCNQEILKKIEKEFDSHIDNVYISESSKNIYCLGLFKPDGEPNFSTQGIVLWMFFKAAHIHFNYDWDKSNKWMQKNLFKIMYFAENPIDSLRENIVGTYRIPCGEKWNREQAIKHYAGIIYSWILRESRPWYKHPRWHIKHWNIVFHPIKDLKRRFWDKCSVCGKRGFKGSAIGNWEGTKIWHYECDDLKKLTPQQK